MKRKILFYLSFLFLLLITIININYVAVNIIKVSKVFFYNVFPFLLPYTFLIPIFLNLGGDKILAFIFQKLFYKLLGLNGYESTVYLTSIIGGYPNIGIFGSIYFDNNLINKKQLNHLVNYGSLPSLFFIFGTIENIEKNNISIYIYLSIILSSLFLIKKDKSANIFISKEEVTNTIKHLKLSSIIKEVKKTISNGISVVFSILGSIILYTIIYSLILKYFNNIFTIFISGILEFSYPCIQILNYEINNFIKYILVVFLLTFGGFSIFTQIISCFKNNIVNIKNYFYTKLKHALMACLIFTLFYLVFSF